MYDLAIAGGGPGGVAAGVYAGRKKLNTLLITENFLGQSSVSSDIQNWIGTPSISGQQLAKNLENHLRNYENQVDIKTGEKIEKITEIEENGKKVFEIKTNKETYRAKTVLVTTGSHRKRLRAERADELEHRGITYCATCDGPLFANKDVVIIGGGNAGFETASQLLAYTKSVTLLHKNGKFKADEVTVKTVSSHPNFKLVHNAETTKILGDNFATGLIYKDIETGESHEIKTDGIFIEIGAEPTTGFVADLVELNDYKAITVDSHTQRTSKEGIWAAGDCTDGLYHQNNIAVGDAIKALENIYLYLKTK
ncbi:FAD-dependent oxidoreductase [Patescibacteria group bacterium]|nr:FAD-dependent oxidoreductase [Patescibacteria group bacterium]MCG2695225.1 FAD-dependent oxidoreductase [Candidatus Parcubacteria bacterium]